MDKKQYEAVMDGITIRYDPSCPQKYHLYVPSGLAKLNLKNWMRHRAEWLKEQKEIIQNL